MSYSRTQKKIVVYFFFKQKTAYEMRISDWSSYVCSSDLIAKHGILIVEFSNQLRERGENKLQAVAEAAALRLRPILMTTGAMVLGAIPLALASGAGADARNQIGWVIVGGMRLDRKSGV